MKASHRIIAAVAFAIVPAAAHAHVVLEKRQTAVGQPYKAVFKVTHGCEGSPTVKVTVEIPEGVIAVKPMPKPGWQIGTAKSAYAREYKFYHGMTLKDGVKTVTWSGGSLPDEYYDEFVLSTFIAGELEPDQSLAFTVRQDCEKGQMTWSETGSPEHQHHLKWPAPLLKLLPANSGPDD